MARTIITTLCTGDRYRTEWEQYCRKGWERYARRHGFEVVMFERPLDTSARAAGRSASWQKCLILEALADAERVIWLDSDIVINEQAPSVVEGVPAGKIGGVISGSHIHPDMRGVFLMRSRNLPPAQAMEAGAWERDQAGFYQQVGVSCKSTDIVQGGVLVLDQSHRGLLRGVYDGYAGELPCYEQFPLSAALLNAGVHQALNSRFNVVFRDQAVVHYPYLFDGRFSGNTDLARLAVRTELDNSYFLHFAMARQLLPMTV